MTRRAFREHCFKILFSTNFCAPVGADGQIDAYLCEAPDGEDENLEFSGGERKICQERVKAVLDKREEIDGILQQASSGWGLWQMGRVELTILRLACFELRFDENIPEKVAVNEAMELAKKFGGEKAPSLVNDVLAKLVQMATIYTVMQLNAYVSNLFREDFLLVGLCVQGEFSNMKYYASGHIYFILKDNGAELRGVIYQQNALGLDMRLADGMQAVYTGAVTVYEKAGVYQPSTKTVEKPGQSELYVLYQACFRALEAEGLSGAAHKKPLPRFVLTLGVVTSPSGAAIHDIQTVARQQNPYVKIVLYPTLVQGEGAAESIVWGIWTLDRRGVDLMIVGRDGGSFEDPWCSNDEQVARAAHACETPLISVVEYESDMTLLDFAADLRAVVSSAAAERGVPNLAAQLAPIVGLRQQLSRGLREKVGDLHARVRGAGFWLWLNAPEELLSARQQCTLALRQGPEAGLNKKIQARRAAFQLLAARPRAALPLDRLTGGYAYVAHADGTAVQSAASPSTGKRFSPCFLDGVAEVRVEEIRREQQEENHG